MDESNKGALLCAEELHEYAGMYDEDGYFHSLLKASANELDRLIALNEQLKAKLLTLPVKDATGEH